MNTQVAVCRTLAFCGVLVILGHSIQAQGAATITRTELDPAGGLRIEFTDSPATPAYFIETRESLDPSADWLKLDGITPVCVGAPVFRVMVPAPEAGNSFFRVAANPDAEASGPRVVEFDPPQGATDVSPALTGVRITFNRPMTGTVSWTPDQQWGGSYATWSEDRRTVELRRFNAGAELPSLTTLRFTLNPNGKGFVDEQGNHLAAQLYAFTLGTATIQGAHVISSVPANNATEVDPLTDTIELRFSEPMLPMGGFESSGWYPWTLSWSGDGLTCQVRRGSAGTPIYGQNVYLRTLSFRTAAGLLLENEYSLRFQTADPPAIRVEASPAKGFHWPYFLLVPPRIESPNTLLIEPNNTGTWSDDPWVHETAARNLIRWRSGFAMNLGCPLLVPVFPRPMSPPAPEPGGIYVHALDRYSLAHQWPGLERIDLQLVAMMDDALDRLQSLGYVMDRRVFMMGFSASGAFTSRFALLHPDRIKAAAPGSPGGWPLAPVASWQGVTLKYSVGIQDLEILIGQTFDLERFRQVPLYIYVGDLDTNDALDTRGMTADERNQICQLLDCTPNPVLAHRWPVAKAIYDSVGAAAQFVIYPGVSHTITSQMYDDIQAFFRAHR